MKVIIVDATGWECWSRETGVRDAALSKTLELPRVAQLLLGVEELFAEQSQRVIIEAKREVDRCAWSREHRAAFPQSAGTRKSNRRRMRGRGSRRLIMSLVPTSLDSAWLLHAERWRTWHRGGWAIRRFTRAEATRWRRRALAAPESYSRCQPFQHRLSALSPPNQQKWSFL